jgi:predicted dehydrogenase
MVHTPGSSQDGTGLNRRTFMKATAAVGAGLVAAPAILSAAGASAKVEASAATGDAAAEKDLGLAVIGCGTQGLILINQIVKMPGVKIRAVCDIWPYSQQYAAARLKAYGQEVATYGDMAEMLAKEKGLDAAFIATPDWCHSDQTVACLKAGLHVYCEEPMAPALKDARAMILAAREAKRLLQVGYQRRSSPRYLMTRDYLATKKACGSILAAAAQWNRTVGAGRGWPKDKAMDADVLKKSGYNTMERFRDWLWYKPFSSGPMSRLGATQVDVLNWFLGGPPRAVMATAVRRGAGAADWPDTYFVLYEWQIDAGDKKRTIPGRYQILQGSSHRGYFEEVTGDEGCLRVSEALPPGQLVREFEAPCPDWERALTPTPKIAFAEMLENASLDADEDEFYVKPPSFQVPEPRDYGLPVKDQPYYRPHMENFFGAIRKGTPLACPGETGYQALASALAAIQSAETQKRVELKAEDFAV